MTTPSSYTRKSQIWLLSLFIILFFSVVSYVNLIYNDYKVDQRLDQMREKAKMTDEQNKQKQLLLIRHTLPKVVEKENKSNLNKIRPGERVVIIQDDDSKNFVLTQQQKTNPQITALNTSDANKYEGIPNPQRWWMYFANQ